MLDRGRRMQAALVDLGLEPGGRVVVLMMNHALLFPLMQGIFRAGGTAIPVMPQAAAAELRYVLADTEAQMVVADADRLATVREAAAGLPHVRHILVQGGSRRSLQARPRCCGSTRWSKPSRTARLPASNPTAPAVMLYSSGTTGRPKGVLLSHANLLASSRGGARGGRARPLGGLARHASAPCRSRISSAWRS